MLELTKKKKTLRTSIDIMVMELGERILENSGILFSCEHDSREYPLQEEGKSPTHL